MKRMNFAKIGFAILGLSLANIGFANEGATPVVHTAVQTAETQAAKTPELVLKRLKDGNERFVNGNLKNRDLLAQVNATSTAQHPVAVVLNCMDSRTPPELVFDQGVGDVFVTRIAGNVVNDDLLGSMEFGTKIAGAKLIAVIGHTNCGAIRGACQQAKLGHLTALLQKIKPAISQAIKDKGPRNCEDHEFIDEVAKDNVLMVIKQIQTRSPVIRKLIEQGQVGIVGGVQDLATGKVTFFDKEEIMPKE